MLSAPAIAARKQEALHHALGEPVLEALADPRVVEVMANPDGRLVLDRLGAGRGAPPGRLSGEARGGALRVAAAHVGAPSPREAPRVAGALPGGERFQGLLPPVTPGPAFAIRKRPAVIWTLADYVDPGVLTAGQGEALRAA